MIGSFERFGGTEEFQKNMTAGKNRTFERFRASEEFLKNMGSRKSGTFKKIGRRFESRTTFPEEIGTHF